MDLASLDLWDDCTAAEVAMFRETASTDKDEEVEVCSNRGAWRMKRRYSSSVRKPVTRSTPARLYQERSSRTISPAVGRCAT